MCSGTAAIAFITSGLLTIKCSVSNGLEPDLHTIRGRHCQYCTKEIPKPINESCAIDSVQVFADYMPVPKTWFECWMMQPRIVRAELMANAPMFD